MNRAYLKKFRVYIQKKEDLFKYLEFILELSDFF